MQPMRLLIVCALLVASVATAFAAYVALAFAGLVLATCDPIRDCRTELVGEYPAPDGMAAIVVSHDVCQNSSSRLEIDIETKGSGPKNDRDILLILDSPRLNGIPQRPKTNVQWKDSTRALISYDTSVRMFSWGGTKVGRVTLQYEPIK